MSKLTPGQRTTLARADLFGSIEGICIDGAWSWHANHALCTRATNSLIRRGYLHAIYFRGGTASASLTPAGSLVLARSRTATEKAQ